MAEAETEKEMSIEEFMNMSNIESTVSLSETESDIIVPIEELKEEDIKIIEKEEEKEKSQVDIEKIEVKNILGVVPIEPVILLVSINEEESLGDMKTIGIPGFINSTTNSFFLLDGSAPTSDSLKEKVEQYLKNRE